ncbi:hypothetical protein DE146DRAFT_643284 [Phaeosphaeria sp. MPI-PUGE-AT-0046c]|nr:hypothetical protein DE146DRAFT_643284 [Phaeosphaeria sp. MPI-PUGE-AT-0046c]
MCGSGVRRALNSRPFPSHLSQCLTVTCHRTPRSFANMFFGSDPNFTSWGPFINHETFIIQPVSQTDFATAIVAFVIIIGFATSTAYIGYKQTTRSREPWKSAYIWMVWLEWSSCIIISVLCLLYLTRVVRPSFYFFMCILLLWTVQTQCLLQIIINRIRIIIQDRRRGKHLMIVFLILMTLVNISVFCIWMPARMQISADWMHVNEIYDRIEKGLYLIMDAYLNIYFIRTVKANLVSNGLQKYNKLVRFNQYMIVVSLLMDVVIIGAMSLPNGFVYAIFHPLAYLVKLNIEMSMARLIKKIALGSSNPQNTAGFRSFDSSNAHKSGTNNGTFKAWAEKHSTSFKSMFGSEKATVQPGAIQKTEEFTVRSGPIDEVELQSQKHPIGKHVHVGISSVIGPDKDVKEGKSSRARQCMSDEETLIKPQPALMIRRQSADSLARASDASDHCPKLDDHYIQHGVDR